MEEIVRLSETERRAIREAQRQVDQMTTNFLAGVDAAAEDARRQHLEVLAGFAASMQQMSDAAVASAQRWVEAYQRTAEQLQHVIIEPLQRSAAVFAEVYARRQSEAADVLARAAASIVDDYLRIAQVAVAAYARNVPRNWAEVSFGEAIDLVVVHGLPLIDVPDAATVAAFADVARSGGDPHEVFVTHRAMILDTLGELVLAAARDERSPLQLQATHLSDVVAALRAGLDRPALIAAVSWTEVLLREVLAQPRTAYKKLQKTLVVEDIEDLDFATIRSSLVYHCVVSSWREYWQDRGDTVPTLLSRHAAVHSYSEDQYTPRNAVWAALLFANLIAVQLHPTGTAAQDVAETKFSRAPSPVVDGAPVDHRGRPADGYVSEIDGCGVSAEGTVSGCPPGTDAMEPQTQTGRTSASTCARDGWRQTP